jgi:hypothetical protein
MPDEKPKTNKGPLEEGYQPTDYVKKGYKPTEGNLDPKNPPQGGSGMPKNSSSDSKK